MSADAAQILKGTIKSMEEKPQQQAVGNNDDGDNHDNPLPVVSSPTVSSTKEDSEVPEGSPSEPTTTSTTNTTPTNGPTLTEDVMNEGGGESSATEELTNGH